MPLALRKTSLVELAESVNGYQTSWSRSTSAHWQGPTQLGPIQKQAQVQFLQFLLPSLGNGPNTVSESTVSNTELSEFFYPHRVPGRELSELLSAYFLCAKANSPSFWQNSPSLPQNSVSSLLRNSTLETVFRPFPILTLVDLQLSEAIIFKTCSFHLDELQS